MKDYADSITAERVRRVINGVPDARDRSLQEGLGGSFTYCELGAPIEMEAMLTGDALPSYSALAAYLLYTSAGVSTAGIELQPQNDDGLFYSVGGIDYYLLYKPDVEWLESDDAALNLHRARRISTAVREQGKKAIVFAAAQYITQFDLSPMGITFCQMPYELYRTESKDKRQCSS